MNKRTLILFILSIFLISVLSSQVLAQDNSVVEVVKNAMEMFTGVFEGTFGTFLDRVSDNPETWMRILFGFAIFSLIYAGLKQITALKEGRTAITLSLIVAIVSVVSVPAGLYIGVGSLYGGFIISALMFVPFAFLSWLTWKITSTNPNRFVYGIFFIFWMIFLMLMTTISITLGSLVVGVLLSVYSFIIAISAVIMAILFVLLLIGGQGAVGRGIARARNLLGGQPTAPDDGGGAPVANDETKKVGQSLYRALRALDTLNNNTKKSIDHAIDLLKNKNVDGAKKEINKANKTGGRAIDYGALADDIVKEFSEGVKGTSLETKINVFNNQIIKSLSKMGEQLEKFEKTGSGLNLASANKASDEIKASILAIQALIK